jgi:ethanolamine kinase
MSTSTAPVLIEDFIVDDDLERTKQIISIVKTYVPLPAFTNAHADTTFRVTVLSGGITNQLYRVEAQGAASSAGPSTSAVVRVFGKETQRIISRESELFYQSLFLKTFCQGKNFLIYEFLDGFRDLDFVDMPKHRVAIAKQFAKFHLVATECSKKEGRFEMEALTAVDTLRQWSVDAFNSEASAKLSAAKLETLAQAGMTSDVVQHHVADLLVVLESVRADLLVGVCHNDLLCANIMRRTNADADESSDGDLVFIDFEYGNRNFLLYDLANHFNEYVGLECDYDKLFPSDDLIFEFVMEYRRAMRELLRGGIAPFGDTTQAAFFSIGDEAEQLISRRWVQYVKLLTLASNALWSCWSIMQAAHSVIDFDFADYATQRWRRFITTKDTFVKGVTKSS